MLIKLSNYSKSEYELINTDHIVSIYHKDGGLPKIRCVDHREVLVNHIDLEKILKAMNYRPDTEQILKYQEERGRKNSEENSKHYKDEEMYGKQCANCIHKDLAGNQDPCKTCALDRHCRHWAPKKFL